MINIDPTQTAHHVKLIFLLIHGIIVLGEWEAVGDLKSVLNHQPEQGPLRHLHVAAWFFMAVFHYFHYRLKENRSNNEVFLHNRFQEHSM